MLPNLLLPLNLYSIKPTCLEITELNYNESTEQNLVSLPSQVWEHRHICSKIADFIYWNYGANAYYAFTVWDFS